MAYSEFSLTESNLFLFVSIDIENSTAWKYQYREIDKRVEWMSFLSYFADDFSTALATVCSETLPDADQFKLWKTLGDELIFGVRLAKVNELQIYLQSVRTAIAEFTNGVKPSSGERYPIDFKLTAWLVATPVHNAVFSFDAVSDPVKKYRIHEVDFFGPSVDVGFRISKYSKPYKFVLSPDIVYLLKCNNLGSEIYCEGEIELKGVNNGIPFPIFWENLDTPGGKVFNFTSLKKDGKDLVEYLEDFYSKYSIFAKPFIPQDVKTHKNKPKAYDMELEKIVEGTKAKYAQHRLKSQSGSEQVLRELATDLGTKVATVASPSEPR